MSVLDVLLGVAVWCVLSVPLGILIGTWLDKQDAHLENKAHDYYGRKRLP